MDNFDSTRQIAIVWDIEDVQTVRRDLSDEQAMRVLKEVERTHDADVGVHWAFIEYVAEELYPID